MVEDSKHYLANLIFKCGIDFHQQGQLEEAVLKYKEAVNLEPNFVSAYANCGVALFDLKRFDESIYFYTQAIALNPGISQLYHNMGNVLVELEQFDAAVDAFNKAIQLEPNVAEHYVNKGNVFAQLKDFNLALEAYKQAIACNPHFAVAYHNKGNVLLELSQFNEAVFEFNRAIDLAPQSVESYFRRAFAFSQLKDYECAIKGYQDTIYLNPAYSDAYLSLGRLFEKINEFEAALAVYDKAIKLGFDDQRFILSRVNLLLLLGRLDEGFALFGEKLDVNKDSGFKVDHESLNGKTVYLFCNQAIEDTILMSRYVKLLAGLGAKVTLGVQPQLAELFYEMGCDVSLNTSSHSSVEFDYQLSLMSLPHVFKTGLNNVPFFSQYIKSHPLKVARWKSELGPKLKPRVGLFWSDHQSLCNVALNNIIPILSSAFEWVSLQNQVLESDKQALHDNPRIIHFFGDLDKYNDLAGLIDCLDLVIGVDSSVIHLSAAMGKKTWVLIPTPCNWRWLLDRTDSPWYPSVRLYRYETIDHLNAVLTEISHHIKQEFISN